MVEGEGEGEGEAEVEAVVDGLDRKRDRCCDDSLRASRCPAN